MSATPRRGCRRGPRRVSLDATREREGRDRRSREGGAAPVLPPPVPPREDTNKSVGLSLVFSLAWSLPACLPVVCGSTQLEAPPASWRPLAPASTSCRKTVRMLTRPLMSACWDPSPAARPSMPECVASLERLRAGAPSAGGTREPEVRKRQARAVAATALWQVAAQLGSRPSALREMWARGRTRPSTIAPDASTRGTPSGRRREVFWPIWLLRFGGIAIGTRKCRFALALALNKARASIAHPRGARRWRAVRPSYEFA